jgi:hypothetical protein
VRLFSKLLGMMKILFQIFLLTFSLSIFAQIGGEGTFVSLNLPYSARHVALGGNAINAMDDDLSIGLHAPSLLNKMSHKRAVFSHSILASGINYGQFGYAHQLSDNKFISTSFRYASYGKMNLTLPSGEIAGDFHAGDVIASAGYGQHINEVVSVGANLNFAFSTLETYQAFGMTLDFSGTLNFADKNTVVTALIRNAGLQFSGYVDKNRERITPNPMIAISHKLAHAPFRLTLLAQNLNRWDLTYVDPNEQPYKDPFTNELIEPKRANFIGKTMHHLVFQVEALFGKHFHLRAAFDYRQREEMKVTNRAGMSGFSLGVGLMLKKFQFHYGFNAISAAGFNNMFTLSTNINEWKK